ncbi:sigma-54-dependent Fis family transcriptional regulator [Sinimarinibacterium sp. CAU 1509]|uniref:sigma-54-dependent transcriptional regulator n=1 Tax=Sinimarinibacterium sp. CAU 1509 TaxID=2562283 RepID=UPI0010AC982C|nr:sigma-54 dependent transcriptional regulator [Sinimarinibacterium sp. CAU 1509]TJY60033.1 sigma-54-dependent Fis family transcriptional regulator [Sinimarinibacterium sp. CAU 1509]
MTMPAVLVVDDELRSQEALRRTLDEDFEVFCASNVDEAQKILEREFIQIVLCDQRMPGTCGIDFLKQVRSQYPEVIRIIISGYTDAQDIIAAINDAGIYLYLLKPWQPDQLVLALKNAAQLYALQNENRRLALDLRAAAEPLRKRVEERRAVAREAFDFQRVVRAKDSALNPVIEILQRVAPYDVSVLLTGESGTGKEVLARALHYASARADKAFVVENCAAMPDQLLESELFGHKRGSFTGAFEDHIGLFQQADGGTIFLDEIGDTSPQFQVKLLRALSEGEIRPVGSRRTLSVNVRVIAATHHDLEQEVRDGRFREDLYYRLAAVCLYTPPLRERPNDIPPLVERLVERASGMLGRTVEPVNGEVMACLMRHRWPGNVRELFNEVLRMVALTPDGRLTPDLLSPRVLRAADGAVQEQELSLLADLEGSLKERMERLEARVLHESLLRNRWNKTRAALELGLSRVGLRAKLSRYGLEKDA